ncbi:MAG: 5'/3'-nucleotidase SurE [Bacillota bacterium]|nr:MAG: 5'/3'-nucleotidase SurE [Bacillota bacterium]
MNILLCNDDGLYSEGILTFAKKLSEKHKVLVVAPERNNSAVSHSLSIFKNIRVKEEFPDNAFRLFSVSGTPADCVKFAHHNLSESFPIDVVLSGINKGHNLGTDTLYSGTVSAAFEGAALGYKAIAFSSLSHEGENMSESAEIASDLFVKLYPFLSEEFIFNVNIPALKKEEIKGIRLAPLGKQIYSDNYEALSDGEFALTGEMLAHDENHADCDVELSRAGYVTVTPMIYDRTAYAVLNALKNLKL